LNENLAMTKAVDLTPAAKMAQPAERKAGPLSAKQAKRKKQIRQCI